jgi:hypothetical protein
MKEGSLVSRHFARRSEEKHKSLSKNNRSSNISGMQNKPITSVLTSQFSKIW